jgi:Cu(I)/Ag(I) efflux system membrane fusion protein
MSAAGQSRGDHFAPCGGSAAARPQAWGSTMNCNPSFQRGASAVAVVAAIAFAVVAALGGYWLGTRHDGNATAPAVVAGGAPSATPAAGDRVDPKTGRRVLYWHDPMVPGQKFDKPGKSPFMDMDLVPVYADEAADAGAVSISPRLAQSFGVRTAVAQPGGLESGFTAVGSIAVDERTIVGVQSRVEGFVEKLHVRATFEPVRQGQPIAELFVADWVAAQEELLALDRSTQPGAQQLADAARNRLRLLGMPDVEIARVEREGRTSGRVTVTAPASGIAWEIGARDGMRVMPGENLVRIAGLGTVWLIAEVPEAQAARVAIGAAVEARAAAFPDRVFKGTVQALLPEVNMTTRTVRARIVLANPQGVLKPGMFVTAAFKGPETKAAVLVPAEAVIHTGKRNVVIVAKGDGKFAPVDVEIGRESGDMVEIMKGIVAGDRVVTSSQFLIDSEASLKGVLQRMGEGEGAAAGHEGHAASGAGPQAGGPVHYTASGVVRDVGPAGVMIEHGPIPAAGMGAMTMEYRSPKGGLPKDVKEGAKVDFEFVLTPKGEYELTRIAGAAPAKGTKP